MDNVEESRRMIPSNQLWVLICTYMCMYTQTCKTCIHMNAHHIYMDGGGKRKISKIGTKIGTATAGSGGARDHMSTTVMTLCSQPWSGLFLFNPFSDLVGHNSVSRLSTVSISEKGKTDLREFRQLRTKFSRMNLT